MLINIKRKCNLLLQSILKNCIKYFKVFYPLFCLIQLCIIVIQLKMNFKEMAMSKYNLLLLA